MSHSGLPVTSRGHTHTKRDFEFSFAAVVTFGPQGFEGTYVLNTEHLGQSISIFMAKCNSCVVFLDRLKNKIIVQDNKRIQTHCCLYQNG